MSGLNLIKTIKKRKKRLLYLAHSDIKSYSNYKELLLDDEMTS